MNHMWGFSCLKVVQSEAKKRIATDSGQPILISPDRACSAMAISIFDWSSRRRISEA